MHLHAPMNIFKGSSTAAKLCGDVACSFERYYVNDVVIRREDGKVVTFSVTSELQTLAWTTVEVL